jgi:hypothetical protein
MSSGQKFSGKTRLAKGARRHEQAEAAVRGTGAHATRQDGNQGARKGKQPCDCRQVICLKPGVRASPRSTDLRIARPCRKGPARAPLQWAKSTGNQGVPSCFSPNGAAMRRWRSWRSGRSRRLSRHRATAAMRIPRPCLKRNCQTPARLPKSSPSAEGSSCRIDGACEAVDVRSAPNLPRRPPAKNAQRTKRGVPHDRPISPKKSEACYGWSASNWATIRCSNARCAAHASVTFRSVPSMMKL